MFIAIPFRASGWNQAYRHKARGFSQPLNGRESDVRRYQAVLQSESVTATILMGSPRVPVFVRPCRSPRRPQIRFRYVAPQ